MDQNRTGMRDAIGTAGSVEGSKCRQCGFAQVPRQPFGCQRCGARGDDLAAADFSAHGTLLQSVVVHLHPDRAIRTPYAVGTVLLDDGPVLRVPLSGVSVTRGPLSGVRGRIVADQVEGTGAQYAFEPIGTPHASTEGE